MFVRENNGLSVTGDRPEDGSALTGLPNRVDAALRSIWQGDSVAFNRLIAEIGETSVPSSGHIGAGMLARAARAEHTVTDLLGMDAECFAGYELERQIHRGGQGVVYRAKQKMPRRPVAIKVMKEGGFATAAERARFESEIRILGQLKHRNIVTIHESGNLSMPSGQLSYYVMEYVDGSPFDQWAFYWRTRRANGNGPARRTYGGAASTRQILQAFVKICDAVNAAHLLGIIHRDLKPRNILVDEQGEPFVLDFGLAKVDVRVELPATAREPRSTREETSQNTKDGQFVGSLPWASPEQADGAATKVDIRTDIYSLGVILYEALTGRFPYPVNDSLPGTLNNILHAEPPAPSKVAQTAGIDSDLDTIVLRCLRKDRERRYQSGADLGRDIGHYLAGRPIEAKRDRVAYVLRKALVRHRVRITISCALLVLASMWMVTEMARRSSDRAAMRERWTATVREARLAGSSFQSPTADVRASLDALWEMIQTGEADENERAEIATSLIRINPEMRQMVSLKDLSRSQGDYILRFEIQAGRLPRGMAIVAEPELLVDDIPVKFANNEPICFQQPGRARPYALLDDLPIGTHVLRPLLNVRFVRGVASKASAPLDIPAVRLPSRPFRFTVEEDYSPNYPALIEQRDYMQRFAGGVKIESVSFVFDRCLGARDDTRDMLRAVITFPPPPMEIAFDLRLRFPDIGFALERSVAAIPSETASAPELLWPLSDVQLRSSDAGWVLTFDVHSSELLMSLNPQQLLAQHLVLEISPSRPAARKTYKIEKFIAAYGRGEAVVEDDRAVAAKRAAGMAYSLIDECMLPRLAIERAEAIEGIDDETRGLAIALLRPLGKPTTLHTYSVAISSRRDASPGQYHRALELAEELAIMEPSSTRTLTALGAALYRNARYPEALTALNEARYLMSAGEMKDEHAPTAWAFAAMAAIHLGDMASAREDVEQLRELLSQARFPRILSEQLLQEAAELVEGVGQVRAGQD